ncbi:MAG: hypothetical protein RJA44_262 [Pseudomonadota bacterium]
MIASTRLRLLLSRLSTGIVLAMGAGLLLPALIGVLTLTYLRQTQIDRELNAFLEGKVSLLASSLAVPAWNYDTNGLTRIAEASLLDPQVVRISIFDADRKPILSLERPERRQNTSHTVSRDLILSGFATGTVEQAGRVELEVDDGQVQHEFKKDRQIYVLILLGQLVLSLVLILAGLHLRVLRPLQRLSAFSNQLASGDFEHALSWDSPDEIGRLAQQMERMRGDLQTSFAEQQAILNNVQVGVIFERDAIIQLANRHAERIFGYSPGRMDGMPAELIYPRGEAARLTRARLQDSQLDAGQRHEEELQLQRLDGSEFWAMLRGCSLDATQPTAGRIWVIEDISARKAVEHEINSLAFYDPLTLLPNRRLLLDRLKHALLSSVRSNRHGALLFIDLDNFKTLNDTLGHDVGDHLLKLVGQRLSGCVGSSDTVARLGGDEFVLILEDLPGTLEDAAAQAKTIGERILARLNQPYQLFDYVRYSTPSIGITMISNRHDSVDDLLKKADMAMYQAKTAGRNTLRFFDVRMQALLINRAVLEEDMRNSIQKQQFQLYYQPQVVGQRRLTGAEALLRWQHPQRGWVAPAEFIHLAEETNLILPLGHWVIETACRQLALWAEQPALAPLTVAVNVSAKQFRQTDFVAEVMAILKQTGAEPSRLKLELTESLLVEDVEDIIAKMNALKACGVGFSLDDFGTGYSSLSYLKRLPLDQLKIDQSFVRNVLTDPNDAAIAKMVVALAGSLNLTAIAEGVELEEQRDFLARQGCHAYQGYLISRPLPLAEFEAFCLAQAPEQDADLPG